MSFTTQNLNDGRYRIEHQMPLNGQAAVFEAYDTVSNVRVVVKEIAVPFAAAHNAAQQEQVQLAFTNQAQLLTRVRHDALLHVRDHFSEVGKQYLVLESIEGKTLLDLLAEHGRAFSTEEVLPWADQLLDALNHLHTFVPPIIHRSIKPQHIKLTEDGKIKLLAFGISDDNGTRINTNLSSSVEPEIGYSPLEQIWESLDPASQKVIINSFDDADGRTLTEPLTAAADIFSFGSTLYHLLTGEKPVDALERSIEILEGNADPLKSVTELVPSVPFEVSEVIQKAMAIKSRERYDSAAIMRQVLKTAQVRAKERADNEADEIADAAELLKQKQVKTLLEQKEREIAEEQRRQAEILEQKLKEAEEQRLAAEKRAAEMERMLKQKELENSIPPQPPTPEPVTDLLDIPVPSEFETSLQMTSEDIFGDILAETETSPKAQVAKPVGAQPVSDVAAEENTATEETVTMAEAVEDNKETEAVKEAYVQQEEEKTEPVSEADVIEIAVEGEIAETTALPEEEQPVPTYFEEPEASAEAETVYSADEQAYVQPSDQDPDEVPGQAFLSMPMIAGGIGLVLCFVVLAGWYFMSSDAEPVAQQPASAIMEPAATPQPEAPVVSETPVVESASQEDLSMPGSTEDPVIEQPAARPEQVSVREDRTPTPRRQALQNTPPRERPVPATQTKPTPQPRKVTVDDLINDN